MITKDSSQTMVLDFPKISTLPGNNLEMGKKSFDMVLPYNNDPFLGHLSTPVTTSRLTKAYLNILPAYKLGLSPLLRGIDIGFTHGYFLFGPFAALGPLRNVEASFFMGFISTVSIVILLTCALLIYGSVSFPKPIEKRKNSKEIDLLSSTGWQKLTSGFILGGFGGCGIAYILIKFLK